MSFCQKSLDPLSLIELPGANMPDIFDCIQRFQKGDERAAELIYNHYRHKIFVTVCLILNDEADAEEVVQDAFVDAFRAIDQYDPTQAQFITWLKKITLNRCRKALRTQRAKRMIPFLALFELREKMPEPSPGPEEQAFRRVEVDEVGKAVQALPPLLREAILLRYHDECTFSEIAYIQKCNLKTAQSRVRLGHAQLKNILDQNETTYLLQREHRL